QRARISLARAVYKRADIYLMDDPLSAVDAHVARHLFESCIVGYLRNTTRILVTHQLQFLRDVDQIIILKNGAIAAAGDFERLSASGLDIATMIAREETEEEKPPADAGVPVEPSAEETSLHSSFRKRQLSIHSVSSVDNLSATAPPEGGREEAEMRSKGSVSGMVYAAYLRASGNACVVAMMFMVAAIAQLCGSVSDWWTGYWVNLEQDFVKDEVVRLLGNQTPIVRVGVETLRVNETILTFPNDAQYNDTFLTRYMCIYIYTGMVIGLVAVSLSRSFMFFSMAMRASTRLHNTMFAAITRAPMRFFHVNPSGRILNRFSKDMGAVDEVLPMAMLDVLQ
ncbi:probable multidrug resistance-associated protein lethal(2)03659, partial [Hyposmocoma kahamanoa]|uniref:probable multidrug resistance-associated protein lethal(2)03659 n=1 Tax=Hyposmocoma kahamanoa TaxID=1477025 RepID=UPI000E6D715A